MNFAFFEFGDIGAKVAKLLKRTKGVHAAPTTRMRSDYVFKERRQRALMHQPTTDIRTLA